MCTYNTNIKQASKLGLILPSSDQPNTERNECKHSAKTSLIQRNCQEEEQIQLKYKY